MSEQRPNLDLQKAWLGIQGDPHADVWPDDESDTTMAALIGPNRLPAYLGWVSGRTQRPFPAMGKHALIASTDFNPDYRLVLEQGPNGRVEYSIQDWTDFLDERAGVPRIVEERVMEGPEDTHNTIVDHLLGAYLIDPKLGTGLSFIAIGDGIADLRNHANNQIDKGNYAYQIAPERLERWAAIVPPTTPQNTN